MMVFISGLSFCESYRPVKTAKEFFLFALKRFKRLVVPCWVFITLYLLFSLLMGIWFPNGIFSLSNILLSYSLISGFGFVWIVRIFFFLSLIAPLLKAVVDKINNQYLTFAIAMVGLATASIVSFFTKEDLTVFGKIINTLLLQFLAYGSVYFLSISYTKFSIRFKLLVLFLFTIYTIIWCVFFGFDIQSYKYPPACSYLSYGLTCSIALYEAFSFLLSRIKLSSRTIVWLSKNSFELYFCHIFLLFFFTYGGLLKDSWILQYLILIIGSLIISFLLWFFKKAVKNAYERRKKRCEAADKPSE